MGGPGLGKSYWLQLKEFTHHSALGIASSKCAGKLEGSLGLKEGAPRSRGDCELGLGHLILSWTLSFSSALTLSMKVLTILINKAK